MTYTADRNVHFKCGQAFSGCLSAVCKE